jgi:hypothetical protein
MNMKKFQILFIYVLLFLLNFFISCKLDNPNTNKLSSHFVPIKNYHKQNEFLELPKWFVEKPEISDVNFCYAYGAIYYDKKNEKQNLLVSAAVNIEKSKKIEITVIQSAHHQTGKLLAKTKIKESDVEIDESRIEQDYTIVKQFKLKKGILALVAENSQFVNIRSELFSSKIVIIDIQNPPEWVHTPPDEKGYIFGVGIAQDHSSPQNAWLEAEKNARADIAKQVNMKILNQGSDSQKQMWEWMKYNHQAISSVLLENVFIIKHGYCKTDRTYYALARMKEK